MNEAPELFEEDLEVILRDIWSSFVSDGDDLIREWDHHEPDLRASVEFRGDCTGAVVVACSPTAGAAMARRMLCLPDQAPMLDSDVADALGELANTIGGSIKGMLPGSNALSLPHYMPQLDGGHDDASSIRLDFTWMGEPLCAEVWAKTSVPVADTPGTSALDAHMEGTAP